MVNYSELVRMAIEAREFAYAPYSNWKVGAALLCKNGKVYKGCNVENAGFTATSCAERTAFFKAVSEGEMDFSAIAIVGGTAGEELQAVCYPCGVCRQVMAEFCDPDEFIIVNGKSEDEYVTYTLREMLPHAGYVRGGNDENSYFFGSDKV
ncbi:MAG: cytidine deaminase [Erysipelotrichaceae bacterium]|nr:cytidine deaminase [Erysipelotrichaceae bacterium]